MSDKRENSPFPEEVPTPEPLNRKSSVGRKDTGHYSEPSKRSPDDEVVLNRLVISRNRAISGRSKNTSENFELRPRNSLRIRATTSIAGSTRNLEVAALTSAKSFRVIGNALGDMVVPRFKLDWAKEIARGGRCQSISAFVTGFALTLGLIAVFLSFFSKLDGYYGYADDTFESLSGLEDNAVIMYIVSAAIVFFVYVFDFYYAQTVTKLIGFLLLLVAAGLAVVGTLFITGTAGVAPFYILFAIAPVILVAAKKLFFGAVDNRWYLLSVALALLVTFMVIISLWTFWVYETKSFWIRESVQEQYFGFVGCNFTLINSNISQEDVPPGESLSCPEAFIVYILPLLVATYAFVFTNVLTFTMRAETRRVEGRLKTKVEPWAQFFIIAMVLGLVAAWVLASLFTTQIASVSDQVLYLSLIVLGTIALIVYSIFGVADFKRMLVESPLGIKVVQFSESDWVSAFVVFLFMPVIALYLSLSFITQLVRKKTPLGKPLQKLDDGADEANLTFTKEAQWLLGRLRCWEWGSVLHKTLWIGVFWFICVVGIGRAVNVFLSFLNELLTPLSLTVATAIFIGCGLGLFMLPPVPGLPIYLTGGILLSQSALNSGFSFAASGWYAVLICSIIKMLSIVIQQKFIGQTLGARSVAIRSACQLNSLELRAMRRIMAVPGWTVPKVAVLVGGPDWPTSVLTGLMKLPLHEMMLGSIPVLLTIIPVSFAGAVLIQGNDGIYASLNAILLSVSLVVQLTPFFVAIHYIARAAIRYADELDNEPLDQEVLKYDEENKVKREWHTVLSRWGNLYTPIKILHVAMVVLSIVSNLTLTIAGDLAFQSFEVTDTIDDKLDGSVFNLVIMPFGGILLSCVGITLVYVIFFGQFQNRRVNYRLKNNIQMKETERPKLLDLKLTSVRYFSDHTRKSQRMRFNEVQEMLRNQRETAFSMPTKGSSGLSLKTSSNKVFDPFGPDEENSSVDNSAPGGHSL